jgi:hypothetical protein
LLPNGEVLVAGGSTGSNFLNSAELYDIGLGFSNSWRPQLIGLSSPLAPGASLAITGAQFRGISQASGGNGVQNSPVDYPLVQLHSLESDRISFLPATSWNTNAFTSVPLNGLAPGFALATVFVDGIPSTGAVCVISAPLPFAPLLTGAMLQPDGTFQFGFAGSPGIPFTVLAGSNAASPLSNWIPLGTATEISPGQYQYNDLQSSNIVRRFYRIRFP